MTPDVSDLFERLTRGDRSALSRAITLLESRRGEDEAARTLLLDRCVRALSDQPEDACYRWAVTGAPGVGKSTLIDRLGMSLLDRGGSVAVLAVDPSSERTGGSILGDKTRMVELSRETNAFIRPSPTGGHLGGVAEATREASLLCQAAGFDHILIETVGVGQSEYAVRKLVDLVIFVTMVGAGDQLQGIKRGILETVDIVAVNKADGDQEKPSRRFAGQLLQALELLRGDDAPATLCTSAQSGLGVTELVEAASALMASKLADGSLSADRKAQRTAWFTEATRILLDRRIQQQPEWESSRQALQTEVEANRLSPWAAALKLVSSRFS